MNAGISSFMSRLHGQPSTYDKKSHYKFGNTLGAGTYGIVREATVSPGNEKVAVKIILKKNVKGNEQMVQDELRMLQQISHPHIVRFVDYFESRDKYYIVTQLATGGELFDRICEKGKFTEKDASQTIKQVLEAVDYLHARNIVHRDLKPENLLYLTREPESQLVLADFGIAKMLDRPGETLTTMAGSFGYAAPEVMLRQGHGKAVDMWSLGVITYTLLCGYSPFRSENMPDLVDEIRTGKIVFHERYWKGVSQDARDFILGLLQADQHKRATSQQALKHIWLTGTTASEQDLLPEIRSYMAKAKLRRGIELVKLANRIERLKMQEEEAEDGEEFVDASSDIPNNSRQQAGLAVTNNIRGVSPGRGLASNDSARARMTNAAKSAIFKEVVLAKVREMKDKQSTDKLVADVTAAHERRKSDAGQ